GGARGPGRETCGARLPAPGAAGRAGTGRGLRPAGGRGTGALELIGQRGGAWWPAPAAARLNPGRAGGTLGYGWGEGGEAITPARESCGERLLSMQGLRRRASITGFLRGKALLRHGGDAGRALRMP